MRRFGSSLIRSVFWVHGLTQSGIATYVGRRILGIALQGGPSLSGGLVVQHLSTATTIGLIFRDLPGQRFPTDPS